MIVDVLVAVVLFFGLLGGWLRGMLYQLGQVAVVVVAFIIGRGLGSALETPLLDMGLSQSIAGLVGFGVVFMLIFGTGSWLLWRFTKMMRQAAKGLSRIDRLFGVAIGGAKSLLYCYIAIVAVIMMNRMGGALPIHYADSLSGRWVAQHNFLDGDEFPRAKALVKLGMVLSRKEATELAMDPRFQAIIMHPKAEPLRTPEVITALANKDWLYLVEQEAFWDLLDEPEIQEHLNALEADSSPVLPTPAKQSPPKAS